MLKNKIQQWYLLSHVFLIYLPVKFCFGKIIIGVEKPVNQGVRHGNNVSSRRMAMSSYLTSYGKGKEVLIMLRVEKGSLSVQRMVWDGVCKEGQWWDNVFLSTYCLSVGRPMTSTPKMYS